MTLTLTLILVLALTLTPPKVRLLESKRATSVGIIVNKMERVLQGKPLRDAIMEVDENTLTWPEGLRMLLDIIPNAEEAQKLLAFSGDLETLDRPERVLRSVADIPRLQGRIQAMIFKAQLESEMDGLLVKQVDCLRDACQAVRESTELHALFQVALYLPHISLVSPLYLP